MTTSTGVRRARLALLLGLLCAACGGSAGVGAGAAAPAARSSGSRPADDAVQRYDTAERPHAVLGAQEPAAVEAAIANAARDAGVALRGDGRLALLARRFAGECSAGARAPALADAARRLGLVDPQLELACVSARERAELAGALAAELAPRVRALPATHFGVYVSGDQTSATAALSGRRLALVPVSRRIDVGTPLRVRGRIDAVFTQPRVVVRGPDGEQSWPGGTGPDFDVQVPTPRAGCYRVALLARAGDVVQTLAELSAYAGVAAHADPCASGARRPTTDRELASLRRGIELRIAQLRAASGLRALAVDAQLERAAALTDAGAAPRPAEQPAALEAASGQTLLAQARADDADALWQKLSGDGTQRAKLLDGRVTHLGVSIKAEAAGGLAAAVLMARIAPAADLELAPARLLDAINRNRGARGAAALRPDATLTRIARRSADAFFALPSRSEREIVADANAELERFGLSYRRVAALAMLVADPLDAAALEPALDAGAGAAGIAVAQGVRGGGGVRILAVVIALGWDR